MVATSLVQGEDQLRHPRVAWARTLLRLGLVEAAADLIHERGLVLLEAARSPGSPSAEESEGTPPPSSTGDLPRP